MEEEEKPAYEDYSYLDGQNFGGFVPKGPLSSTHRKGPIMDPTQARIGCFPKPKQAPNLLSQPHLLGLQLPFKRGFNDYKEGPPLEDLTPIYDEHL